jgi:Flp pilus assembly protein TadG
MKHLIALLRNRRGTATIEFALASLFLFATIMVALDFGYYTQQKLQLGSAVGQAAVIAFNQQTGSDTTGISNYVKAAAATKATPTVSVTCNGTNSCGDGKCSCISGSGNFAIANSCNAACGGSDAISGNYMKIVATTTYNSVIVPDRWLGGSTMTSTAVVRLQ